MKKLAEIQEEFKAKLKDIYDDRELSSIFLWCMDAIDGLDRKALLLDESTNNETRYSLALEGLEKGEPVQYVFGKTNFYDMEFKVSPAVLIPRPETEELVAWIVEEQRHEAVRILDIGTGSGCIAISLASALPNAKVYACDISEEALEVAGYNAEMNSVNVELSQLDVLNDNIPEMDVVVSNHPYIPYSDSEGMTDTVLEHEPHLALFVDNNDPLVFYRTILEKARTKANVCYFEIHEDMRKELTELLDTFEMEHEFRSDLQAKTRMLKVYL